MLKKKDEWFFEMNMAKLKTLISRGCGCGNIRLCEIYLKSVLK